jgi:spermidine/putrescine transport system ATP-binding protein
MIRNIRFEHITKSYNGELIVENISLEIPGGTFFALLGPSGSGKTTLLRLIAGLETADSGSIFLGDEDITHMPVYKRRVNTVFQNYALFPHMDVFDNVAYSLTIRNVPEEIIEEKVVKILKAVGLDKHIHKAINNLSGGQKQRVALARAVINEPEVLLLDEPLAALDLKLREKMLIELIDLQSTLKTTFVYVTHDQFEALTVADKMAIMNDNGEIEQVGTPKEIYEFPVSTFVAAFVGTTNLLKGILQITDELAKIEFPGLGMFDVVISKEKEWMKHGHRVFMSIRPEKIEISKTPMTGFSNSLQATVQSIVYHGRSTQYNVQLKNGEVIQVFEQNEEHFPQEVIDYDDHVFLYWQKENVVLLEK